MLLSFESFHWQLLQNLWTQLRLINIQKKIVLLYFMICIQLTEISRDTTVSIVLTDLLLLFQHSGNQVKDQKKKDLLCSGPKQSIYYNTATTQIGHLIWKKKKMKQEEPKRKNFNAVLLIFWGCLNNYLADVVSKAAITPGRRAPHYQWGQQSVLCFRWGDNTLTPNSVNQPSGFLSNGKDSQIKTTMFCMPVTMCHTGESGSPSKANTGADGVVYSALHFVW